MSNLLSREEFLIEGGFFGDYRTIDSYLSAEFIVLGNDVGTATITFPGLVPLVSPSIANPGDSTLLFLTQTIRYGAVGTQPRIRLRRIVPTTSNPWQQLVTVFSGQMIRIEEKWDNSNGATTVLTYQCDNVFLDRALVKPEPSTTAPPYSTNVADIQTAAASTLLLHYTQYNCGISAAPSSRQHIAVGSDPSTGASLKTLGRWQNLLEFLQEISNAAGNAVMFQVLEVSGTGIITFNVVVAGDLTGDQAEGATTSIGAVTFSVLDGGMRNYDSFVTAPVAGQTGNYFFIGATGTGTSRTIYEIADTTNSNKWGVTEQWIDRSDISDTTARDAVVADAETQRTDKGNSIEVLESAAQTKVVYGGGYTLGSKVRIQFGNDPTQIIEDTVWGCRFTFAADGTVIVRPKIGRDTPLAAAVYGTIDLYGQQIRQVSRA